MKLSWIWRFSVVLFLGSFFIYQANMSILWNIEVYDTLTTKLLPFTLLTGKGMTFDTYTSQFPENQRMERFLVRRPGGTLPASPVLPGIVITPLYVPVYLGMQLMGKTTPEDFYEATFFMEKIVSGLVASFGVVLLFWFLWQLFAVRWVALLGAIAFAIGTPQFSTSSQFLWQHGFATLFLVASQICLLSGIRHTPPNHRLLLISIGLGLLAGYCRYPLLLYPVVLSVVLAFRYPKYRWHYPLVAACGIGVLVGFHVGVYGSLLGPYAARAQTFTLLRVVPNFLGLVFSPARGILWYTPFLLLGLGYGFVYKRATPFQRFFLSFHGWVALGVLVVVSVWDVWWGGVSYGGRLLSDLVPLAIILSLFVVYAARGWVIRLLFISTLVWSIGVHLLGALSLGNDAWNVYPQSVDVRPERVWDLSDAPFLRIMAAGIPRVGWQRVWYRMRGIQDHVYTGDERKCTIAILSRTTFLGYERATIAFTNRSRVPWVTGASHLLHLRSTYRDKAHATVVDSPIGDSGLPAIIAPGETVRTTMLILPPGKGEYTGSIAPVQEDAGWWNACRTSFSVTNL